MSGAGLHFIGAEEEALVLEVLRSRHLSRYTPFGSTAPTKTALFEAEFARRIGSGHCLGLNSCTSALIVGLRGLGIGPGDEVIVPGYTFVATIASVIHVGATPVLAEIDESLTIDPEDVRRKITPRTRAVIAVHMLGTPADLPTLRAIADEHGIALVEDVAQACGGAHSGRALGSWGSFGAFSFNVYKVLTCGDGGALVTDDPALHSRAFSLHDHGFRRSAAGGADDDDAVFGFNLRMHELAGAVALAQTRKLDAVLDRLRSQKRRLLAAVGDVEGLERRPIHDRDGECATTLVYRARSADLAGKIARSLGTRRLAESVKHNYSSMGQLLRLSGDGSNRRYGPGALPRTDDLLSRSIGIGVGVRDAFLGFAFGIEVDTSPEELERTAAHFRRVVAAGARQ